LRNQMSQVRVLPGRPKRKNMSEFKVGIYNLLKKIAGSSFLLAVVYTIGHIVIAMICNNLITGADFTLAAVDAIVEPMINGVWFYVLHKLWRKYSGESKVKVFK
jgi:uncharacterized membrane protein